MNKTEEFFKKVQLIHKNEDGTPKYDYSKVNYINAHTKVCIICHEKDEFGEEHGEFWIRPCEHLNHKTGCKKCSNNFMDTERFKKLASLIHDNKYDYSKVEYVNSKTKVCIICPKHGEFYQVASYHLSGNGCQKCVGKYRINQEEFIAEARKIHGNKYDYSKVEYKNKTTKVCIICPIHGEFWQTPKSHLKGENCPKCANRVSSGDFFIEKAKEKHKDEYNNPIYDYSKVVYKNSLTKVCIICPVHGEFWQSPGRHLMGDKCPRCNVSKLEDSVMYLLNSNNIKYFYEANKQILKFIGKLSVDFYLPDYNIAIECQGEQHFKPIDYFGGEKEYKIQKTRDIRKYNLCKNNGISLFYLIPEKVIRENIYNEIYNEHNVLYYDEIIPFILKIDN